MMDTEASSTLSPDEFDTTGIRPVGGPVPVAWREGTLTRAKELESLCAWIGEPPKGPASTELRGPEECHIPPSSSGQ